MNVTNGPTIWAGDGSPRVGPTSIPGYYDFNTLTYGITHGTHRTHTAHTQHIHSTYTAHTPHTHGTHIAHAHLRHHPQYPYSANPSLGFMPILGLRAGHIRIRRHAYTWTRCACMDALRMRPCSIVR